jgi:16S rRNA (adenine1518-N6/adenine1519-N6)-dimethyltransferase
LELKKALGQHFLVDQTILKSIVAAVQALTPLETVIEVGPGMGALTQRLLALDIMDYRLIEKDDRFVIELPKKFPKLSDKIYHQDVLTFDFKTTIGKEVSIVGNYPYNISNLIMFWIIENSEYVVNSVGMFQKEVAKRIASKHDTKEYGILSVLTQAIYEVNYLFDIPAEAFDPPPKVISGVISMQRRPAPLAEYTPLKKLVKAAFNQRRKMLSNSLKGLQFKDTIRYELFKNLRPEQLSVEQFCALSEDLV